MYGKRGQTRPLGLASLGGTSSVGCSALKGAHVSAYSLSRLSRPGSRWPLSFSILRGTRSAVSPPEGLSALLPGKPALRSRRVRTEAARTRQTAPRHFRSVGRSRLHRSPPPRIEASLSSSGTKGIAACLPPGMPGGFLAVFPRFCPISYPRFTPIGGR